ncbi:MAG: CotH kinase family protein [Prevotella sp.]|nr:CotH kinase family protein [Prevotella sp.]
MKNIFLLFIALLIGTGSCHAADETAFYLVGWLNNWSTTDKSYPLSLQDDKQTWAITVPAAGNDGWFKVAPASAYSASHFWDNLYCAPYDGCSELSGTMVFGNEGAWLLPNKSGVQTYTISINPTTMQFRIIPDGDAPREAWSGTLPVLFINTGQPVTSKDSYVSGTCYIDALGLEGYESMGSADSPLSLQVKGRGNYTWTAFDKKPYRLKFADKVQPLGMNSNKHFTLLAHADDDMAFLRNTVGFELSRMMKLAYTPSQQPVEVVLNGEYIGLYMLTEHIRVAKTRVNITEQDNEETDPDKITGGWLLEIDNYEEENQLRMTESNGSALNFTCHSPEVLSAEQKNYMTDFLQHTDRAIYNQDKSSTEWEKYIDMDALARYYIVQEVMDDAESFHGSCYLHKERGNDTKLVFGPVWDFGNAFRRGYNQFIYQNPPFGQNWIGEIARFPRFQQVVRSVWQTFLANDYPGLDAFIDGFADQIAAAVVSDGKRWPQYSQANINDRKQSFRHCLTQKVDFLRRQWGEAANGIESIDNSATPFGAAPMYNLNGQRMEWLPKTKGVLIRGGKKVMMK